VSLRVAQKSAHTRPEHPDAANNTRTTGEHVRSPCYARERRQLDHTHRRQTGQRETGDTFWGSKRLRRAAPSACMASR
jgi:hypothetical protein